MRIDDPKRLVLQLQVFDQPHQHRMLDDIGEIAGVKGVAIVHRVRPRPCPIAALSAGRSACHCRRVDRAETTARSR